MLYRLGFFLYVFFCIFRVLWRKKLAMKEKKREIEFRQRMIAKVNEANKFDPIKYVDDYLEDLK